MSWRGLVFAFLIGSSCLAQERERLEIEGFTVWMDERLLEEGSEAALGTQVAGLASADLHRITRLVHPDVLKRLRTIEIVIDFEHGDLGPAQYHPSAGWLKDNGYDEFLEKKVHIAKATVYADAKHLFVQPAVMLHELAHAYHDQFLGFDHPAIRAIFKKAEEAGIYESVLHINGRPKRRHYALSNHKEYFAEGTEAFLYVNDFYPFVRAELQEFDVSLAKLLKKVWIEGDLLERSE